MGKNELQRLDRARSWVFQILITKLQNRSTRRHGLTGVFWASIGASDFGQNRLLLATQAMHGGVRHRRVAHDIYFHVIVTDVCWQREAIPGGDAVGDGQQDCWEG